MMTKRRYLILMPAILLAACGTTNAPEPPPVPETARMESYVQVSRVIDGDTLDIIDSDHRTHRVRLRGIDAPERDQPFGAESTRCLSKLTEGRTVRMSIEDRDRHGRLVSELFVDVYSVNALLTARGCAWWDEMQAPYDMLLGRLESQARSARRGLWRKDRPIPPWEWRRRQN